MDAPEFCAGVARKNITPETSIWMSGYPYRDRPSEGALHPLWAKALAIEDRKETRVVIVATDVIGLPREITDLVSMRVQQEFGIEIKSRPRLVGTVVSMLINSDPAALNKHP